MELGVTTTEDLGIQGAVEDAGEITVDSVIEYFGAAKKNASKTVF